MRMKINGVSYEVTNVDGKEVYNPPLPESVKAWFARGREDMQAGHAPKLRTDSTFNSGRQTIRDQFNGDEAWLTRFNQEYRKQTGMDLPSDGVYMGQLAEGQFDAKAVVKSQSDVNKLIKRKQSKMQREADAPPVRLAEDLVKSKMRQYREQGDKSSATELRHKVIEKHGAPV
jgi:hypothetical protein